jgi:enterochelin esterase family protein
MFGTDNQRFFPGLGDAGKPKHSLVWVACGKEDFLFGSNTQFKKWLASKNVAFSIVETPGAHTWMVWHRNLAEFLSLLFR